MNKESFDYFLQENNIYNSNNDNNKINKTTENNFQLTQLKNSTNDPFMVSLPKTLISHRLTYKTLFCFLDALLNNKTAIESLISNELINKFRFVTIRKLFIFRGENTKYS